MSILRMEEFIVLLAALICPRLKFLALLAYGRMFSVLIYCGAVAKRHMVTSSVNHFAVCLRQNTKTLFVYIDGNGQNGHQNTLPRPPRDRPWYLRIPRPKIMKLPRALDNLGCFGCRNHQSVYAQSFLLILNPTCFNSLDNLQ